MEKKQKETIQAFRLVLCGRSGVGKTYNGSRYLLSLIKEKKVSPKRVLVFSQTWKTDPSVSELIAYCKMKNKRFEKEHCFESIDTALISKLYGTQKAIKESKPDKLKQWLIYLDDQITSDLFKHTSKDKTLLQVFTVGRHYNISICVGIQRLIGVIAPTLREQFTDIALFQLGNTAESLAILQSYNELRGSNTRQNVELLFEMYQDAIAKDSNHGCFVIHVMKHVGEGRYERGLGSGWFYDIQGKHEFRIANES